MPRKITTIFGPRFYDEDMKTIREAGNLVRWKPAEAMEWMQYVKNKVTNPIVIDYWNLVAKNINATLDSTESMRYYNKKEYWGEMEPIRLELIETTLTLEDYVALGQFSG